MRQSLVKVCWGAGARGQREVARGGGRYGTRPRPDRVKKGKAEDWQGGALVVPAGETAAVELRVRVGPLDAGSEAGVGAELLEDGARRDQVRGYYRTA